MKLLAVLLLLAVVSLTAAEIVNSFKDNCPQFFIRNPKNKNEALPPTTLKGEQYKLICQRWGGEYRYATLYDTKHRIPVYSAYSFYQGGGGNRDNYLWKIEPQLDQERTDKNREMKEIRPNDEKNLPYEKQALNMDYDSLSQGCGYDKGHLFPNGYAEDDQEAESTFTLTNAAPQKHDSNQEWANRVETPMSQRIQQECAPNQNNPAYIITGVVPGDEWLPIERRKNKITKGVNIPKLFWSAYYCKPDPNKKETKSGAYIADQIYCQPKKQTTAFHLRVLTVDQLNDELKGHYKQSFRLFEKE